MQYVSTRGEAPALGFADVLLAGLARDGGLYVPETYPQLGQDQISAFATMPYSDVAEAVISPYTGGDIAAGPLREMIRDAYATFRHPAVVPLVQLGAGQWLLELFHGPTLAFKDVAMQLLARMMDHVLAERDQRATIVGATSGDTGGAAIEAFRGRERTDIFILFPTGRVSDVQRKQMTTVQDANVHALSIDGSFDDCQRIVKSMFVNSQFRDRVALSGVNSINWGRIVAQAVYYFSTAAILGAPHRPVSFCVPTGNFGDVLAGYVAKRMGLPVDKLVVATNVNDILKRAFDTGRYEVRDVVHTASPSMDIQVSSNFERLLFEETGRDAAEVRSMMAGQAQSGMFTIPQGALSAIRRDFDSARCSEQETADTQASTLAVCGYLADPHTAVGLASARSRSGGSPMVTLSTAHPAKFPDATQAATGVRPQLPEWLSDLNTRPEWSTPLPADSAAVEAHILRHARAAQETA
ncbi:threonine synthase [Tepidamorphus sp. 3E244]|uniref:threonine synthase n=1 Tax=Tepidamorphus sp. 3E244 TaxID=3385498 RepID=UPI0038FCF2F2